MATRRSDGAGSLNDFLRPELFRALCDPVRLALLARLAVADQPVTVGEAGRFCSVHISGVSRHLSLLRQAGLVRAKKQGREVAYELDTGDLVQTLRSLADALERCSKPTTVRRKSGRGS